MGHASRQISVPAFLIFRGLCAIRTSLQVLVKHPDLRTKELLTLQSMLMQRVKVGSWLVFTQYYWLMLFSPTLTFPDMRVKV